MGCSGILTSAFILLLGHYGLHYAAQKWLPEPNPLDPQKENVIIKIDPEELLRSGPVHGSALVLGTSAFAKEDDFKIHLVKLMKHHEKSLHQLDITHIQVARPMSLRESFRPNLVLTGDELGNVVPMHSHMDFSAGFDHSRGISRKAVQDALMRIANEQRKWEEPARVFARSLQSRIQYTNCETFKKHAEDVCSEEGYLFTSCEHCDDSSFIGTTCTCQVPIVQTLMQTFSNTIWAVVMCITGAIVKANVMSQPRIAGTISSRGDFDGICQCFDDCNSCLCGWFCPAVRTAQTYHVASMGEYCQWLLIMAFAYGVPSFGPLIFFIIVCCQRGKLRERAAFPADCCMDCLCSFFCIECVICQEARLVDRASKGTCGGGVPPVVGTAVGQPVVGVAVGVVEPDNSK